MLKIRLGSSAKAVCTCDLLVALFGGGVGGRGALNENGPIHQRLLCFVLSRQNCFQRIGRYSLVGVSVGGRFQKPTLAIPS